MQLCASVEQTKWALLDGDKIAALFAKLLQQELSTAGLTFAFTCAVVQTAYANGASTQFIRSLGMPIYMAKTGVKYLHHKAQEFDVGIYFEANGHGTVIFSERFQRAVGDYVPVSADGRDRVDLAYARLKVAQDSVVKVVLTLICGLRLPICSRLLARCKCAQIFFIISNTDFLASLHRRACS
jgi:hypothetical protein